MKEFIHLHTHSYYSFLDGTCSPEEIVLAAKKSAMKAIALTDHNGLYGAVEFFQKAVEFGIKPIIGAEITLALKLKHFTWLGFSQRWLQYTLCQGTQRVRIDEIGKRPVLLIRLCIG